MRGALVKIADPSNGVSREEYESICAALGMEPRYAAPPEESEDAHEAEPGPVKSS